MYGLTGIFKNKNDVLVKSKVFIIKIYIFLLKIEEGRRIF